MTQITAIHTDDDLARAIAEIERFFAHEPRPGTSDAEEFDRLCAMIEAYEDEHYPI